MPSQLNAGVRRLRGFVELTELEVELLRAFAQHDLPLHEIFAVVAEHHADFTDAGVFAAGRAVVATWIDRSWLVLAGDGAMWGAAHSIADVVPLLDRLGADAVQYFVGAPWLRLGPAAYADIEGLAPAV